MQRERQTQHRGQPDPRRDEDVPVRALGEREQSCGARLICNSLPTLTRSCSAAEPPRGPVSQFDGDNISIRTRAAGCTVSTG